jgi:hypothetical protein
MLPDDVRERVTSYIKYQATKPPDVIIALVRESQAKFLDVVSAVDETTAARKPAPDEWSLYELIRHVVEAESGVARLVTRLAAGDASERRAAPAIEAADDAATFAAYIDRLRETNAALIRAIEQLPATPDLEATSPHPFFGPLNCKEWAAFQKVHDEDHVQHARKILAAVS